MYVNTCVCTGQRTTLTCCPSFYLAWGGVWPACWSVLSVGMFLFPYFPSCQELWDYNTLYLLINFLWILGIGSQVLWLVAESHLPPGFLNSPFSIFLCHSSGLLQGANVSIASFGWRYTLPFKLERFLIWMETKVFSIPPNSAGSGQFAHGFHGVPVGKYARCRCCWREYWAATDLQMVTKAQWSWGNSHIATDLVNKWSLLLAQQFKPHPVSLPNTSYTNLTFLQTIYYHYIFSWP